MTEEIHQMRRNLAKEISGFVKVSFFSSTLYDIGISIQSYN